MPLNAEEACFCLLLKWMLACPVHNHRYVEGLMMQASYGYWGDADLPCVPAEYLSGGRPVRPSA